MNAKKNSDTHILTNELVTYLDHLLGTIEENALNGLQVANSGTVVKIATAVTASIEAIEKAAEFGAQALIVHHGIFLKNEPQSITNNRYKKIKLLIDNDIALLSYHLPLDAHREVGNNWKAARDLGLYDLKPFMEINKTAMGVIGSVGNKSFDQFKKQAETYYGNTAASVKVKEIINNVAIISGGADKCIGDAARAGADCFITGRVDEPVWDAAHEEHISFLGLGHYATETIGVKAIAEKLRDTFSIPCDFIKTENPF